MGGAPEMCFECLQRRIEADFSGRLTFIHGLSDSPLPFGSSALVELSVSGGVAPQKFVLNYVPYREEDCFPDTFEGGDYSAMENMKLSDTNRDQEEVSIRISTDKNSALDTASTECRHFSDGGRNLYVIGCETCRVSSRFCCSRTITSLAPIAQIGCMSYELFEDIASRFSSGSVEDHILHSLSLLIEGKSAGRDSINFLSLVGLPSFNENGFPGCIRHPNIGPILGMLKSSSQISVVLPKTPYTLENILHYSPGAIKSDWHVRLLIYQLLSALSYLHGLGIAHGNVRPSNIILTGTSWCWLQISEKQLLNSKVNRSYKFCNPSGDGSCFKGCLSRALYADLNLSQSGSWQSSFYSWWKGELSNFEYLLILNRLAGRRWGDHAFYTVMPWVIDFSVKPDENSNAGWRDLSKSKWRLAKGDEQLDFTYSTSEIPHHVSDECLSELAVCSYKARRLPLSVLRTAVRSVYEPNEYPSNMQRLYQWTPDECIPEFYCDPRIFCSLHSSMPDLAVPSWAGTPEEFIKLHRDALEATEFHVKYITGLTSPLATKCLQLCSVRIHGGLAPTYNVYSSDCLKDEPCETELLKDVSEDVSSGEPGSAGNYSQTSSIDSNHLLENIEVDDDSMGYQELLLWKQTSSSKISSKRSADDMFAVGLQELPHHVNVVVEACIQKEWNSMSILLHSSSSASHIKGDFVLGSRLFTFEGFSSSRLFYAGDMEQDSSTTAASVLLIGSSEELGVPITVHQTILPLILSFGKGLCIDGVDVLIRIGGLFGEKFVVKHILPLLNNIIHSCISTSHVTKPEPMQSWGSLALIDCLTALDGLVPVLTTETIVKELIEDGNCPYVKILMHRDIGIQVLQKEDIKQIREQRRFTLVVIKVSDREPRMLPRVLLELSAEKSSYPVNLVGSVGGPRLKVSDEDCIESRMDLALLLYPQFASLLGIEKLRQCCATWLLLEQFLLRRHNWKWEYAGESNQSSPENGRRPSYHRGSTSENTPAKLLLNGVGWSRPQSQVKKGAKNFLPSKSMSEYNQNPVERHGTGTNLGLEEPWYWFPSPAASWDGLDFTGRAGGPKDELPWKIRASIIQSIRAHHGALRSFAVCQNECTVFTAGIGPGFKGNIQKWELSRVDCVSSYNGHDEVVNDICVLASGRVASCDGTVHIWNGQNGKLISVFSESSLASTQLIERDEDDILHFNPLPSGMLSTAFHGNSYTTMDYLEFSNRLLVGTGNGSLRFIDVNQGQKLHLWRSESIDSGFPSLISSICSSSSVKMHHEESVASPSWVAAAFSTGYCKLFDMRSGKIIASWQAHDGYVTK
ncbi:UNVERIFIED_CONTAM: protein GFS12, partial [Sesamum radiatum]